MWNLSYANRKCNELEKRRDHIQHLERITNIKCSIDKKEPKKPTFLFQKANRAAPEQINWKKTYYENTVLLKKILDIENKPSPYHPKNIKIHKCPAYEKTDFISRQKTNEIHKENAKLYKRLVSAKTHYSTEESIKNYKYTTYISTMISNTKNNIHPNVTSNFDTPSAFKKKYQRQIMMNSLRNSKFSNNVDLEINSNHHIAGNQNLSNHNNNFEKNLKCKNILAAIDINKSYNTNKMNKKRPYSANKQINRFNNSANDHNIIGCFSKSGLSKSKSKAHDNLDMSNFEVLRNINVDYYQKQIDSLLKQYGTEINIDENVLRAYLENLNSGNFIVENEDNSKEENKNSEIYNHRNNQDKSDIENPNDEKIENEHEQSFKGDSGQGRNNLFYEEEVIAPDEADNFHLYNLQNNNENSDQKELFMAEDDIEIEDDH